MYAHKTEHLESFETQFPEVGRVPFESASLFVESTAHGTAGWLPSQTTGRIQMPPHVSWGVRGNRADCALSLSPPPGPRPGRHANHLWHMLCHRADKAKWEWLAFAQSRSHRLPSVRMIRCTFHFLKPQRTPITLSVGYDWMMPRRESCGYCQPLFQAAWSSGLSWLDVD